MYHAHLHVHLRMYCIEVILDYETELGLTSRLMRTGPYSREKISENSGSVHVSTRVCNQPHPLEQKHTAMSCADNGQNIVTACPQCHPFKKGSLWRSADKREMARISLTAESFCMLDSIRVTTKERNLYLYLVQHMS